MPWKSVPELIALLESLENLELLGKQYAISTFYLKCIYSPGYQAPESLCDLLALTPSGVSAAAAVSAGDFSNADLLLALFGKFFHHDILIDWSNSDYAGILSLLQNDLAAGRLTFPDIYGRSLHDRFVDLNLYNTQYILSNADTWRLVTDTSAGVFQHGTLVSGPAGLLNSLERRWVPSSMTLPIAHCPDASCFALHNVSIMPPDIGVVRAYKVLDIHFLTQFGSAPEWPTVLSALVRGSTGHKAYVDMPMFLAECLSGPGLMTLLARMLKSKHHGYVREQLKGTALGERAGRGSPDDFVRTCTHAERLQVALLFTDNHIEQTLDTSIKQAELNIPVNEVRKSRFGPRLWQGDTYAELSSLGLRQVRKNPFAAFCSTIFSAYRQLGLESELKWRLSVDATHSTEVTLSEFLRNHGLEKAVDDLVLASEPVTKKVFALMGLDSSSIGQRSKDTTHRMLWKLGFKIPRYDDSLSRLQIHLSTFNDALLANDPTRGEDGRDAVRSAGVNLFVSVESFLDSLVSYNVWLLSRDHFAETRFRYNIGDSRLAVRDILGETLHGDDTEVRWQTNGENALGTQLQYLAEAVKWMKGLCKADRTTLRRTDEDISLFSGTSELPFALNHKGMWADAHPDELQRYISQFTSIADLLLQADLAGVRNGLDHNRSDDRFPTSDAMLACAARLRDAVERADISRHYPKIYWLVESTRSITGAWKHVLEDHRQRKLLMFSPLMVNGIPAIPNGKPVLVAPANLLGTPDSLIVFSYVSQSKYADYWRGYPRRPQLATPNDCESITLSPPNAMLDEKPADDRSEQAWLNAEPI
jgi:hypothetical protein